MRQVGVLAAAGLVALDHHVDRLVEDHRNAELLANALAYVDGVEVDPSKVQTNMVVVTVNENLTPALQGHLAKRGIVIRDGYRLRLGTHMDVTVDDIQTVVSAFEDFFVNQRRNVVA